MEFQWWMLFALIPLLMLAFIGLMAWRIVRVRRRARRFLALSKSERLIFARRLVREGDLPLLPRLLAALAAGYLALPIDLIPDFIPVLGHADDFLVVTALSAVISKSLPPGRIDILVEEARAAERARRGSPPPRIVAPR